MNYYFKAFRNYFNFSGRARRGEYWSFFVFNALISFAITFISMLMGLPILGSIYSLLVLVPGIAVSVRRAHDVGVSGWMMLIPFYNIYLAFTKGEQKENKYGPICEPSGVTPGSLIPWLVIPVALIVSTILFTYVLGDPANFEGGDPIKGHPLNVLGTIHKGGFIVPLLIAVNLIVWIFFIERFISISLAQGKGSVAGLVQSVKMFLAKGELDNAISVCDKQRGSVAAVLRAGLLKYKAMSEDTTLDKEAKVTAIKQELEEATALELPMLSKNLVILSTCGSLGVLVGLLGTVKGMISSFEAMATAGAPDATALSLGISEALINTFLGIMASAFAIILYNFFNTRIDSMTFAMDEANFTVTQTFASKH